MELKSIFYHTPSVPNLTCYVITNDSTRDEVVAMSISITLPSSFDDNESPIILPVFLSCLL